jgi:hypothetical protein
MYNEISIEREPRELLMHPVDDVEVASVLFPSP